MNYHDITKCDMINGTGLRVVLWCSHCEHHCNNCQNPETWHKDSGIFFDENAKQEIYEELNRPEIRGLTCSGGDPLSTLNRDEITEFLKGVKERFPHKDIWVYTGYTWEQLYGLNVLKYIDVLVDGKYIEELSIPHPQWRGSSNQRIIDVQESLKQDKVILL